jgi:hypothetical protein
MRWFRSQVRSGAVLALAALAPNLAVAFGHHHFETLDVTPTATERPLAAGHDDDGHEDHAPAAAHPCFACIVTIVTAIASAPPSLPPHRAIHAAITAPALVAELQETSRSPFEARAPPSA